MSRPLDRAITAARERRARAAAQLAAEDAQLAALLKAQAELVDATAEEHLHPEHSDVTISDMQLQSEHSLGVRIAAGRAGQSESRKAQIAANLTDKQVSALLKVSRSTVCKWHLGTLNIPDAARKALAKRGIPASVWRRT